MKPENLVLDRNGFCRVVDFGLAKRCTHGKTWTLCGSLDYLAPEVITGKGHDWGVDCWELGVLLYELTHGYSPFYDEDKTNTARKVMEGSYSMPQTFSRKLVDLISRLLTHQSKRLGRTEGGMRDVRKHPWFDGFDWQALLDRKMQVPWVPDIGDLDSLGTDDDCEWNDPDSDWKPSEIGARTRA